ncbi:aromatic ring-hydroxylating dioxygenase subunit alpha [Novosphingobium sp. SG720]|uniref:aromatic ring-hydroxylating dioxygenase subunit alpha n=1 Tax=Novosphingobium sp. SG720 TaxID=2586998 RepID=UPI0014473459|nr:aromatic ring-hydroxylating dioxygenase subunit alpha [Novosphingobium sp. SG720]NKJ44506.1 vanillate O-demethylase monooxygenase subunit [Novosphingobium sp. SG720]
MSLKADFTQGFVRNQWYAAGWASEVCDRPVARRILNEPVVLFRASDGKVGALEDQCPHRLAPLSLGECVDGGLRCGYHGMVFGRDGVCVSIPAQDVIPPTARARAYPVIERYGLIWLWPGHKPADQSLVPHVPAYGMQGWEVLENGYQHHGANYRIEIENLMDPAHTTYLHKETIGNPAAKNVPVSVAKSDHGLKAYRWIENIPPTPLDRASRDFGEGRVDRQIAFHFALPATSFVDIAVIPAGSDRSEACLSAGVRTYSYKFLTPETQSTTHFFWLHIRNFRVGDAAFNASLRASLEKTFQEDNVMASAIQQEQERTGLRQKTALAIDRAPMMALKMIDQMARSESAGD